jgi:hypothetical protein
MHVGLYGIRAHFSPVVSVVRAILVHQFLLDTSSSLLEHEAALDVPALPYGEAVLAFIFRPLAYIGRNGKLNAIVSVILN